MITGIQSPAAIMAGIISQAVACIEGAQQLLVETTSSGNQH